MMWYGTNMKMQLYISGVISIWVNKNEFILVFIFQEMTSLDSRSLEFIPTVRLFLYAAETSTDEAMRIPFIIKFLELIVDNKWFIIENPKIGKVLQAKLREFECEPRIKEMKFFDKLFG